MTLLEVVIAMIVLSLAVVAIVSGMTLLASSSLMARQRADVGAALRSAAEQVKSFAYVPCNGSNSPQTSYTSSLTTAMPASALPTVSGTPDVVAPSILTVENATTGAVLGANCTAGAETGLEAVELSEASTDGKVSETLWVVKRSSS